jgi:hypothetical protein
MPNPEDIKKLKAYQRADWAYERPDILIALWEAAEHYEVCKSEQAARRDTICPHVHWNGGTQTHSCVARLFGVLAQLRGNKGA